MSAQQQTWDSGSWAWDPYKLVAAPATGSPDLSKKSQYVAGEVSTSGSDELVDLGSSKRTSRPDVPVMCQVDGCLNDLAGLKEYHNRYKICHHHLKIPSIVRAGHIQRFCQQCGRFHDIGEFDGDKRSCRARLQRHNARRRKKGEGEITKPARKQPRSERSSASFDAISSPLHAAVPVHGGASDSHVTGNSDSLPDSPEGSQKQQPSQATDDKMNWRDIDTSAGVALDNAFSDFLAQENYHASQNSTSMSDIMTVSSHDDMLLMGQDLFGQSQATSSAPFPVSGSMHPNAMLPSMPVVSNMPAHASAQPCQLQTDMQPGPANPSPMYLMQQQALFSARQQGYYEGIRNQQQRQHQREHAHKLAMSMQASQSLSEPELPRTQLQQQSSDVPVSHRQAAEPSPFPSFSLSNNQGMSMDMSDMPIGPVQSRNDASKSAAQLSQQRPTEGQQHLGAFGGLAAPEVPNLGVQQHAQQIQQHAQQIQQHAQHLQQRVPHARQHAAEPPATHSQASVLSEARGILSFKTAQPHYVAEEQFVRMSAKLFNCTPAHLPHDLKQNLMGLLSCVVNSIEGYIMPGCVQLTLNALVTQDSYQAVHAMGVRQAFEVLMQQGSNRAFWGTDMMLLQWQDSLALIKDGNIQQVLSGMGSLGVLPQMPFVSPLCISNRGRCSLRVSGFNLATEGSRVLCRHQGMYLPAKVSSVRTGTTGGQQQIEVHLPAGLPTGALQLEVMRGGFLSPAQAVLVLDNNEAVAELSQLESLPVPGLDVDSLLLNFGRVLEYSNCKQAQLTGRNPPTREYAPADELAIAATARRLLSFACQVGWAAVSEMLLPAVLVDGQSIDELVSELDKISDQGLTLLHHAVRSRSASLVEKLCTWGVNNGYEWDYAAAGPHGLTPLHLAALLGDGGKVATTLADACPGALTGWASVKAQDGSTAADLADVTGAASINSSMKELADDMRDEPYRFNPETGELVEDDDMSSTHETANEPKPDHSTVVQSQHGHHLPEEELEMRATEGDPFESQSESDSPNLKTWLFSTADDAMGNDHVQKFIGMHSRSKGYPSAKKLVNEEDLFLLRKGHNLKLPPRMFNSQAAVLSSVVIGIVGFLALGLRYCLDYKGVGSTSA